MPSLNTNFIFRYFTQSGQWWVRRTRHRRSLALQPNRSPNFRQLTNLGSTPHNNNNFINNLSFSSVHCVQGASKLFHSDFWLWKISSLRKVARSENFGRAFWPELDSNKFRQGLGLKLFETIRDVMPLLARSDALCATATSVTKQIFFHRQLSMTVHFLTLMKIVISWLKILQLCFSYNCVLYVKNLPRRVGYAQIWKK